MKTRASLAWVPVLAALLPALALGTHGTAAHRTTQELKDQKKTPLAAARTLSHDETLCWIAENKAWRLAHKTKPIWARLVDPDEVGKEFQTADHAKEKARSGFWLCVGVAGEPWFQSLEKIEAKYELHDQDAKKFDFDRRPRTYPRYEPKGNVRNWVAQVKGPGIAGFYVRPCYDPDALSTRRQGATSSRTTCRTLIATSRRTFG